MPRSNHFWVIIVAVASIFCWQAAQSAPREDEDAELYRLFVDALEHVDRSYVKPIDRRKLVENAIAGMLNDLDPYSNYIGKDEWKQFNRHTVGKFGGIGIQISKRSKDDALTVISPLVGTPAYEAGILAGDRIVEVEGEKIRGLTLSQVVDRLTGEAGTKVSIMVQHKPYDSEPFAVTLTRAEINVESILGDTHGEDDRWSYFIDDKDKIAYVRINSFIQGTTEDLKQVLEELLDQGMKGLVLDLRYNPGGLLSSAIGVCDLFITEGKIVGTTGRNTLGKTFSADKEGTLPDFPMVVLVNQYSASASEIVSACLQDHKRAIVIGERTWGKGSVQNVIELEGGKTALKLTTASYQRPNGHNIHRFKDSTPEDEWGVKPNEGYEVALTPEEHGAYFPWRQSRDRVLGKVTTTDQADSKPKEKAKEEPKEKPKEEKKSEKKEGAEPKAEDGQSEKPAASKKFEDRQLAKALEYLRSRIHEAPAKADDAEAK